MFATTTQRRLAGLAAAAAVAGALASAAPAAAYTCSASAVRGTVLGTTGIEPVVAGSNSNCSDDNQVLGSLPAPLAGTATATTVLSGPAGRPAQQRAGALGSVESFSVGALRSAGVQIPAPQVPEGLNAIGVPLPAELQLLGLPSEITVDAHDAAMAKVPARELPDVPLAAVRSLRSTVGAQCLSGLPNLVGASSVQGLTGLGEALPTAEPVDRVITLLDAQEIPLSDLDPAAVQLPAGLSFDDPLTGEALRKAVGQALSTLPPILLPAAVGEVHTSPAEQSSHDGVLEQRALRMTVTMAGTTLADLVMGIARVATDGLSCAEAAVAPVLEAAGEKARPAAPVQPASQLALSCAQAKVTLVNVIDRGRHVLLVGAADKKLVGKRVRIVQTWNGRTVAVTKVRRSGFFRAKAPVPSQSIRYTSSARYKAKVGREKSLPLKLHRRMRFGRISTEGRKVTLRGRIFGPRTGEAVVIRQSVNCRDDRIVKRIRPNSDGTWKTTVRAPRGKRAVTYRAITTVLNAASSAKFPTFTLPGYVSL